MLDVKPTVDGACAGACAVVVAGVLEGRTERSARVDLPGGPLQVSVRPCQCRNAVVQGSRAFYAVNLDKGCWCSCASSLVCLDGAA